MRLLRIARYKKILYKRNSNGQLSSTGEYCSSSPHPPPGRLLSTSHCEVPGDGRASPSVSAYSYAPHPLFVSAPIVTFLFYRSRTPRTHRAVARIGIQPIVPLRSSRHCSPSPVIQVIRNFFHETLSAAHTRTVGVLTRTRLVVRRCLSPHSAPNPCVRTIRIISALSLARPTYAPCGRRVRKQPLAYQLISTLSAQFGCLRSVGLF